MDDNPADVSLLRLALDKVDRLRIEGDRRWRRSAGICTAAGTRRARLALDLAILDLNLPENDGLQILKAIRENRAFAGVPVAVLSSGLPPPDITKIQEFNFARYIPKPPTLVEFPKIGSSLNALIDRGLAEQS